MRGHTGKISPFFISVTLVLTVTAAIIICAAALTGAEANYSAQYFFICYSSEDNSVSAGALSGTVGDLGGAGYVLGYGGEFYVTVACYYSEHDAERVQKALSARGENCFLLKVETGAYPLQSVGAKSRKSLFEGNLKTLGSLSALCYECANGLDTGEMGQSSARAVIGDVEKGLNGLKNANPDNCFTAELKRLGAVCSEAGGDMIYSKDLRKLQIAIIDTIINIELY